MEREGFKPSPINIPQPAPQTAVLGSDVIGWNATGSIRPASAAGSAAATSRPQSGGGMGITIDVRAMGGGEGGGVDGGSDSPFDARLGASEIRHEDLTVLSVVGQGSSGMVQKVLHRPTQSILALKVIPLVAEEKVRRAILLELRTLHESVCPSIVTFFGAYYREGAVQIALEYMDASLADLLRATARPIPEAVLGAIAPRLLDGLVYLHRVRRTIHRDIKPSNLLIDMHGSCKIADFGVSGELQSSLSKCASWVGTVHYMSPERISGGAYNANSDLWSLGLSLLELALGRFPYSAEGATDAAGGQQRLGFWDLLDSIVEEPAPPIPKHLSAPFADFLSRCLHKAPEQRPGSAELRAHAWVQGAPTLSHAELSAWVRQALAQMPARGAEGDEERAAGEGADAMLG